MRRMTVLPMKRLLLLLQGVVVVIVIVVSLFFLPLRWIVTAVHLETSHNRRCRVWDTLSSFDKQIHECPAKLLELGRASSSSLTSILDLYSYNRDGEVHFSNTDVRLDGRSFVRPR